MPSGKARHSALPPPFAVIGRVPYMSDTPDGRLESWKQIAAYLKRDIRTVQRWEAREGLPVHRHLHAKIASVYAYRNEIDEWWERRSPPQFPASAIAAPRPILLAACLVALAGTMAAAGFWLLRRSDAPRRDLTARRLWQGPGVDRLGALSPDGLRLCFADPATHDLSIVTLLTGETRRLTNKPPRSRTGGAHTPVFSSDGERIAYVWDLGGRIQIRTIGSDGLGEAVIPTAPDLADMQLNGWAPGDLWIYGLEQREDRQSRLVLIRVGDGSVKTVQAFANHPPNRVVLSPDGRFFALDQPSAAHPGETDIVVVSADGGSTYRVPHPGIEGVLGWRPDSAELLFTSDRLGAVDAWRVAVKDGRPVGAPVLTKKELGHVRPLNLLRNGSLYYGLLTAVVDIYSATIDWETGVVQSRPESATRRVIGMNEYPDISPDGETLAYVPSRLPGRPGSMVLRNLRTGRDYEPDSGGLRFLYVRWFREGNALLAVAVDQQERYGLYKVDAGTGRIRLLASQGSFRATYSDPIPLPGGQEAVFKVREAGVEPSPLFRRHFASGRETRLLPSAYRIALSPDGGRLAYSTFDDEREYVGVLHLATGAVDTLHSEPRQGRIVSLEWTADAKWILYAQRGTLWRVPAKGGQPVRLQLEMEALTDLRVHPNGRRLIFKAGSPAKSELWVMENLTASQMR